MQNLYRRIYIVEIILSLVAVSAHAATQNGNFQINIHSRENVRSFYNSVYNSSNSNRIEADWKGDVSTCDPGDSSQAYKNATLRRINFFRAMAGVPSWVTFTESVNAKARLAALSTSANNSLSHFPPQSWKCYSSTAAQGSASANLALGKTGANAITAYIEDAGGHNLSVGHRRWLLYPQTQVMGSGDIAPEPGAGQKASAIIIFDNQFGLTRPQTRDQYVSWPPAGFVPYQLIFPRWSFSLPNGDFSQAIVSVTLNNREIPLEVFPVENGYGENTIVWKINRSELIKPSVDLIYHVSIHNVLINGRYPKDFNYKVKAFDPAKEGVDTVLSTISGAAQIVSGNSSQYQISFVPNVSEHQVLTAQPTPYLDIATAEYGLEQLTTNAKHTSNIISNFTSNSGIHSYHLSHSTGSDQQVSFNQQFLVNPDSSLVFYSRISCASVDEVARVQVSLDDGNSWQDIYTQTGVVYGLRESHFTSKTISLENFVGKIIRLKFNYTSQLGWYCSIANSGWYLDDIVLNNVDGLTNPQLKDITDNVLEITSNDTANYVLVTRGILFNGFAGQWGPAFSIQVIPESPRSSDDARSILVPNESLHESEDNTCSLDVDKNGSVDALTDGLLLIRHMFGYRGNSLIRNALGADCIRCTSTAIEAMLNQCTALAVLDIDGNGEIDALTDGLLNMRFIFGIRGDALINNSVGNNCSRCTTTEIETYLTEKLTR